MNFNRTIPPSPTSPTFISDLVTMLRSLMDNLAALFDKGISLVNNADTATVFFTSNGSPDTEDAVAHNLRRAPVGYIVTSIDKAAEVYLSGTAANATTLYLKTSTASVAVKLLVF